LADWLIAGLVGLLVDWWVGWAVMHSGMFTTHLKKRAKTSLHFHLNFEGRKLSKIYAQWLNQQALGLRT